MLRVTCGNYKRSWLICLLPKCLSASDHFSTQVIVDSGKLQKTTSTIMLVHWFFSFLIVGIEVKLIYRNLPRELLYRHAVVTDMKDDYTVSISTTDQHYGDLSWNVLNFLIRRGMLNFFGLTLFNALWYFTSSICIWSLVLYNSPIFREFIWMWLYQVALSYAAVFTADNAAIKWPIINPRMVACLCRLCKSF